MIARLAASLAATTAAVILLSALAIFVAARFLGLTLVGAISLYFLICGSRFSPSCPSG